MTKGLQVGGLAIKQFHLYMAGISEAIGMVFIFKMLDYSSSYSRNSLMWFYRVRLCCWPSCQDFRTAVLNRQICSFFFCMKTASAALYDLVQGYLFFQEFLLWKNSIPQEFLFLLQSNTSLIKKLARLLCPNCSW